MWGRDMVQIGSRIDDVAKELIFFNYAIESAFVVTEFDSSGDHQPERDEYKKSATCENGDDQIENFIRIVELRCGDEHGTKGERDRKDRDARA